MKYSPSWINLLKSDNNPRLRFWWKPEITDAFLDKVLWEDVEWKIPPEWDMTIYHYSDKYHHLNSRYTINRNWEVKWLRWEVMKYFFHPNKRWPRVRIQVKRLDEKWKIVPEEKEIWILQMMDKKFGRYFPGYKLKTKFHRDYMLVPKDWNYNNMRYDNLHYVCKDEHTKKKLIKDYLKFYPNVYDETIANLFNTSQWYVRKVRQELVDKWNISRFSEYQRLQREIWIEFSEDNFEIYKILIKTQWKLSNMEIAKLLWTKEIENTEDKSFYTNKVVRARKKLTSKWLIHRFNELFESKRAEIVERIRNKANSGETSQQIADAFWLKKEQIDNLTRQIKKEEARKNQQL